MEKEKLIKQMDKYADNKAQISKLKNLIAKNMKECSETEELNSAMQEMYKLNMKYSILIERLDQQNKSIIQLILSIQECS